MYEYRVVYYHLGFYPEEVLVTSSVSHYEDDDLMLAIDVMSEMELVGLWSEELVIVSIKPNKRK